MAEQSQVRLSLTPQLMTHSTAAAVSSEQRVLPSLQQHFRAPYPELQRQPQQPHYPHFPSHLLQAYQGHHAVALASMTGTVAIADMQPLTVPPTLQQPASSPSPPSPGAPESRKRKHNSGDGKYLASDASLRRLVACALVAHAGWTAAAACQEMGLSAVSFSKRKWIKRYVDAPTLEARFAEVLGEKRGGARPSKKPANGLCDAEGGLGPRLGPEL